MCVVHRHTDIDVPRDAGVCERERFKLKGDGRPSPFSLRQMLETSFFLDHFPPRIYFSHTFHGMRYPFPTTGTPERFSAPHRYRTEEHPGSIARALTTRLPAPLSGVIREGGREKEDTKRRERTKGMKITWIMMSA